MSELVQVLLSVLMSLLYPVEVGPVVTLEPASHADVPSEFEDVTFENCSYMGNGICGPLLHVGDVLVDANGWVFTYNDDMFPLVTGCVDAAPCESMQCSTDYICESREGKKDV